MDSVTLTQVQELVERLPAQKLPTAYRLLDELIASDPPRSFQEDFMRLPRDERRRLLSAQAKELATHYEQTASERETWQVGDFVQD